MANWGYHRLADTTNRAGHEHLLQTNNIAKVPAGNIVRETFYPLNPAGSHTAFINMLSHAGPNDNIVVINLSHISMEFVVLAKHIGLIGTAADARGTLKNLNFVSYHASLHTGMMTSAIRKHFFDCMTTIGSIPSVNPPAGAIRATDVIWPVWNGGGDGGGNGGC